MLKKIQKKYGKFVVTGPVDYSMFFTILFLNIYGIIMIYSASYNHGLSKLSPEYFMNNQIKWVIVGIIALFVVSYINYHWLVVFGWLGIIGAICFTVALKIPAFSISELGATRWLKFGPVKFQAAEPIKLCMMLFFSFYVYKIGLNTLKKQVAAFAIAIVMMVLVYKVSNNLSTGIIIFGICFVMIESAVKKPNVYIYLLILVGIVIVVVAGCLIYVNLKPYVEGESFRITRIRAWLNPADFASSQALQPMQSLYAIGAGGFWGKGLGQSLIKFKLPYPYNDFILAVVCEEMGVFGVVLMMILFGYLLIRIYKIAAAAVDVSGKALAIGVFAQIAVQLILNVMVVTSLFPTTGVTLPFFSSGGTSVFFLLAELGILFNIDKYTKDVRFRAEAEKHVEMVEERRMSGGPGWKNRLHMVNNTKNKRR